MKLALIGTAAGMFSGLFGVSGGTVIVPLLVLWLGYREHVATGTSLAFSYLNLAAGDYFFRISGDIGGDGVFGNAYRYRFEVSEVPLPPALLLFATALGGMAVASYRRRRKNGGAQA